MRALSLLTILVLPACAPESDAPIQHKSAMQQATRGLVLHDGGLRGHAGMFETNCPFETQLGRVTGDYQLPDDGEEVQDGGESALGPETVVLVIPGTLFLLEKSTGDYVHERHDWKDLVASRLTDDGVVGLVDSRDGCRVEWRTDDVVTSSVDVDACDQDSFDASRTGRVAIGDPDSGWLVTPDGAVEMGDAGDLVAFDDVTGLVYRSSVGAPDVRAFDPDAGTSAWTTELDGEVQALAAAGGQGAVVVSVELTDGTGAIVWLDGWSGEVLSQVETPSAAPAVTASDDGGTLALVLAEEAHFYTVDLGRLYR
jgi:hypothetical protein